MKKVTLKELRSNPEYINSFMKKGNKKLTDYKDPAGVYYKYAQFNIPAKTTCPYATKDCKKFCYAKRDERFTAPKMNRINSFQASREKNFTDRMIYTIKTELSSKRFSGAVMILRLHESGDFYNMDYLKKWIDTINYFMNNPEYNGKIIFQAYTKSFKFFIDLKNNDSYRYQVLCKALRSGIFALSLSYDKSMELKQAGDLFKVKASYPNVNIYAAIKESELNNYKHDTVCDCANCSKCKKCIQTNGQTVAVAIH